MPISFSCPSCGQQLQVPSDSAHKKARCSACQAVFRVPSRPADTDERRPDQRPADAGPSESWPQETVDHPGQVGPPRDGSAASGRPAGGFGAATTMPDRENPYAAPTAAEPAWTTRTSSTAGYVGHLAVSESLGLAWRLFRQRLGDCLALSLVLLVIHGVFAAVAEFLAVMLGNAVSDTLLIVLVTLASWGVEAFSSVFSINFGLNRTLGRTGIQGITRNMGRLGRSGRGQWHRRLTALAPGSLSG